MKLLILSTRIIMHNHLSKIIGRFTFGVLVTLLLFSALSVSAEETFELSAEPNYQYNSNVLDTTNVQPSRIITSSGRSQLGDQVSLDRFFLGPKNPDLSSVSRSEALNANRSSVPGYSAILTVIGSAVLDRLTVFYHSRFMDRLFVGYNSIQPLGGLQDPRLQVNGAITIKELADPSRTVPERVCVNDVGKIEVCTGIIDTTVVTAQPGSCASFSEEYLTDPTKLNATDTDNTGAQGCLTGVYQDLADADLQWSWRCLGIDLGTPANCTADKLIELDEVGIGTSASKQPAQFFAWLTGAKTAEASSSICSERNNLNENGIYRRTDTVFVREGDTLSLLVDDGSGVRNAIDYSQLLAGSVTSGTISIYDGSDLSTASVLPEGEYLISGDSVINENRDPLESPDGFTVRHGVPVSAVSLVISNGSYIFDTCGEDLELSNDEIRDLDIAAIQEKLEEYYQENGEYPQSGGATVHNGGWSNSANTASWATLGTALGVDLPVDPVNNAEVSGTNVSTGTNHQYHYYSNGPYGCGSNQWYMLVYNPEDVGIPPSLGAEACSQNFNYAGTVTVGECKDPACDATWQITPSSHADWSNVTCNTDSGTRTRDVSCRGTDGQVTSDANCWEQTKPETEISCTVDAVCKAVPGSTDTQPVSDTAGGCLAGTYQDNSDLINQWRWQCVGLNGGTTDACTSTRTTYAWETGSWGNCDVYAGTQTRSVICRASTGDIADSEDRCTDVEPSSSQPCGVNGACLTYPDQYDPQPASSNETGCSQGQFTELADTTNQWRWQCAAINEGTTASCQATRITYDWVIDPNPDPSNPYDSDGWGICDESTHIHTRSVKCKSSQNLFVADNKCNASTRPVDSETCLTRDEQRDVDIAYIKQKLDEYYQVHGQYPQISGAVEPNSSWASSASSAWDDLESALGVPLPRDPINTTESPGDWSSEYRYNYFGIGVYGCSSPGQWYMLVYNPETEAFPESPGAEACDRDFQYNGTITTGDCKDPACDSSWQTTAWGGCQADGYKYRTVSCRATNDTVTAETNCWEEPKPDSKSFCGLLHLDAKNDTTPFQNNSGLSVVQDTSAPTNATEGPEVFKKTGYGVFVGNDIFPIDTSKIYTLSGNFKSTGSAGASTLYLGLIAMDEDENHFTTHFANRKANASEATIQSFTNSTITTQGLTNLDTWYQNYGNHVNSLGFYYDGDVSGYPDYVMYNNAYTTATGDIISLVSPIPGSISSQIIPGLTKVKNHYGSGWLYGAASNQAVPSSWTTYSGSFSREVFNPGSNYFLPETKYARVYILASYAQNTNYELHFDDIKVWESGEQPYTNGSCKSYTGNYLDQPAYSIGTACNSGTWIDKTSTSTQWRWRCKGYSGGSDAECTANRQVHAVCGSSNGVTQISQPVFNCKWGSPTSNDSVGIDGTWNWTCNGINGGNNVSCSANRILNGVCTSYTSQYGYTSLPGTNASNGCDVGTYTAVSNSPNQWRWQCNGLNGGTNASCTAVRVTYAWVTGNWGSCDPFSGQQTRSVTCHATPTPAGGNPVSDVLCTDTKPDSVQTCPVPGDCKPYSNTYTSQPGTTTANGCNAGSYVNLSNDGTANVSSAQWRWRCNGLNGGTNESCNATISANAQCGSVHTNTYTSRPSPNCNVGQASWTDSSGTDGAWNWTCSGLGGGAAASCYANWRRDAVCLTPGSSAQQPATNTATGCSIGSYTDTSDTSSNWQWQCNGVNGGANASCSSTRINYSWTPYEPWGACNPSTGIQTRNITCKSSVGASPVADSYCEQWVGPLPVAESQTCTVNAICKPYTGDYTSQPGTTTANGCNAGTYTNLTNTVDHYKWRCNGLNGGTTANCEADWERDAVCTSYTGSYGSQPASSASNGCVLGTYTNISNLAGEWRWQCNGYNTGANLTCTADATYNWVTSAWSSCSSTTAMRTRTVSCQSATGYTDSSGSRCDGSKPPIEEFCGVAYLNASNDPTGLTGATVVNDPTTPSNEAWGPAVYNFTGYKYSYSDLIDVDAQYKYMFDANFKSVGSGGLSKIYFGGLPYNAANQQISSTISGMRKPDAHDAVVKSFTSTTITTAGVADLSTWYSGGSTHAQSIGFYYDGDISKTPDYTWYNGIYSSASGDTIQLNSAMPSSISSNIIPGTTVVKNHYVTYDPRVISYYDVPTTWTSLGGPIEGETFDNEYTSRFPYGTRKIRMLIRANYGQDSTYELHVDDVKLWKPTQSAVNGSCKTFTGSYTNKPGIYSSGLCNAGTVLERTSTETQWLWSCRGLAGGSTVNCSANRNTAGVCKAYSGSYASQPASNSSSGCEVGTFSQNSNIGTAWQWTCNGYNNGADTLCQANPTYIWDPGTWGSCGAGGIQTRTVTCLSSTGGTVPDSYCSGTKPATSQNCPVNAQCKSYTNNYTSQPGTNTSNGCNLGTYSDLTDGGGYFKWQCNGLNGGGNVICYANWQRGGQCKTYSSNYTSQPGTNDDNGCLVGGYSNVSNTSTQFKWSCSGTNGGAAATCSANWQRAGQCKTYSSNYSSQPASTTANGCNLGSYANVSETSTAWRWSCSGVNGGGTTTCSASPTYTWITGGWGTCAGGTQTRSVICRSSSNNATVSDSYCGSGKPTTSQACWELIADYRFDLCSDGYSNSDTLIDSSGNGYNATNSSFLLINSGTKIGNSVDFDGDSQYIGSWPNVSINQNSTYGFYLPTGQRQANTFTIAGWYWPDNSGTIVTPSTSGTSGTSGQQYALEPKYYSGSNAGMGLSVTTNAISVFEHGDGYLPALAVAQRSTYGWVHVVVVYNNKQPKIYINGSLATTGLTSTKSNVYSPTRIGHGQYGVYNGDIDEVKVYSGALSASEVSTLYNSEVSASRSCSV